MAGGLDHLAEAEAVFLEVRTAFLAGEAAYDAALVRSTWPPSTPVWGAPPRPGAWRPSWCPIFRSREIHR